MKMYYFYRSKASQDVFTKEYWIFYSYKRFPQNTSSFSDILKIFPTLFNMN